MSMLIPPQFDTYGVSFWIPSQVEPTVALIGTSLPALSHPLHSAALRVSHAWSQLSTSRISKQGTSSTGTGSGFHRWSNRRSGAPLGSEPKMLRGGSSTDSGIALHTHQELFKGAGEGEGAV